MPNPNKQASKGIYLTEAQSDALERRHEETDIPIKHLMRRAIEAYLATPHEQMHRLKIGPREVRKLMDIPDDLWDAMRERKTVTKLDLSEQAQIAVSLFLDAETQNKPIIAHGETAGASDLLAEIETIATRLVDERITHHLAHLPAKTGTLKYLQPEVIENDYDADLVEIKMLAKPPCGPWKVALEEAETYRMSADMAKMLGVKKGDFLVTADGQSMEGAGIPDGALVLMRPLKGRTPDANAPTLVQVVTEDNEYFGTIKRWNTTPAGNPDLRDGRGLPYELPANVRRVEPVAVQVGIIARSG